jgi:hypothetical protein
MAVQAAYLVPEMYDGGGMRAHVFPLQPHDAGEWDALVAVDFPVSMARVKDAVSTREFGVILQRGDEIAHTFHRSITLQSTATHNGTIERRVTFLEPATIRPGHYVVTAVLSDPLNDKPFTAKVTLTVPEIPKKGAFLTGPILGRLSGDDVVVYGNKNAEGAPADRVGDRTSFRPLLVNEVNRDQPLSALTHACVVKPRKKDGPWVAGRTLLTDDGAVAGAVADIEFARDGHGPVECRRILDELPVRRLLPGRYTFQATVARVGAELTEGGSRQAPIEVTRAVRMQP